MISKEEAREMRSWDDASRKTLEQKLTETVEKMAVKEMEKAAASTTQECGHSTCKIFGGGLRAGADIKARFDLLPAWPLFEVANVFTYGSLKYKARNWELGMPWGWHFSAMMRHTWRFWGGETRDLCKGYEADCKIDETFPWPTKCRTHSGLHHLAHAAFACLALMEYLKTYPDGDDRADTVRGQYRTQNPKEGV